MSVPNRPRHDTLRLSAGGAVRVHPEPAALPRLRREGPGRNRFDDPLAAFVVRYAANTLHGCLVETLARFRPHPDTEALLAGIDGVADSDPGEALYAEPPAGLADWLAAQQVGHLQITSPAPLLVDIEQPELLDQHPVCAPPSTRPASARLWTRRGSTRRSSGSVDGSAVPSPRPCPVPSTNGCGVSTGSGTGLGSTPANGVGRSTTTSR